MSVLTFANPRRARRRASRHHRRRRNPAPVAAMTNPRHHRRHRVHHRRRNPAVATIHNPGFFRRRRRSGGGSLSFGGVKHGVTSAAKAAIPVALGMYLSRYLVRWILKEKDQGLVGYGANAGAGLLLAGIARAAGQKGAAPLVAAGAVAAVFLRAVTDMLPKLSNPLGDYVLKDGQLSGIPELDGPFYVRDSNGQVWQVPASAMGDFVIR